jgi:hypothetical protein
LCRFTVLFCQFLKRLLINSQMGVWCFHKNLRAI